MINFLYFILVMLSIFPFTAHSTSIENNNKVSRSFWHPKYQRERLDYCTRNGEKCGKYVADHYCQILGYDYSTHNVIDYNIGLTHFLSSSEQCKGWRCNGFMTIVCAMSLSHTPPKPYHYREKSFVVPRFNHYRVDWCYDHKQGCGLRAANSFCSRLGFLKAKEFERETQVYATKTIGSQELCFGNQCNAFKSILCYR